MEEFALRNGRDATDEEVKMWVETLREASGGAAKNVPKACDGSELTENTNNHSNNNPASE